MRVLVLGAGAVGGYFGAAMQLAGIEVTYLVRPGRAQALARNNLLLDSEILGSQEIAVKTILAEQASRDWDIIILTCKAYDLPSAMKAIETFIGPQTSIMPLLNGFAHLDILKDNFGVEHVLGATCKIFADLSLDGKITQNGKIAELTYGLMRGQDLLPEPVKMVERLRDMLNPVTGFTAKRIDPIERALWDKWALLAPLAAMTSLMRANVGEINATRDGTELMRLMMEEVAAIAASNDYPIDEDLKKNIEDMLTKKESLFAASMAKDIAKGKKIEGHHIVGDLLSRAKDIETPMLKSAHCHLQVYENKLKL